MSRSTAALAFSAVMFAAIAGAPVYAAAQSSPKPGWIADSKSGCKIWNPAPQAHETIRWSGGCKDGLAHGTGTLQWYENGKPGDRYDGTYDEGKRNGHGVVTESNGTRIEGDWRDDTLLEMGGNEI